MLARGLLQLTLLRQGAQAGEAGEGAEGADVADRDVVTRGLEESQVERGVEADELDEVTVDGGLQGVCGQAAGGRQLFVRHAVGGDPQHEGDLDEAAQLHVLRAGLRRELEHPVALVTQGPYVALGGQVEHGLADRGGGDPELLRQGGRAEDHSRGDVADDERVTQVFGDLLAQRHVPRLVEAGEAVRVGE